MCVYHVPTLQSRTHWTNLAETIKAIIEVFVAATAPIQCEFWYKWNATKTPAPFTPNTQWPRITTYRYWRNENNVVYLECRHRKVYGIKWTWDWRPVLGLISGFTQTGVTSVWRHRWEWCGGMWTVDAGKLLLFISRNELKIFRGRNWMGRNRYDCHEPWSMIYIWIHLLAVMVFWGFYPNVFLTRCVAVVS